MQMLHDGATETIVEDMVLERADNVDSARKKLDRSGIERLNPSRIDQGHRNALFLQLAGSLFRDFEHVSESENGDLTPMLHDLRLADFKKFRRGFWHRSRSRAAGVADGDRAGIVIGHRPEHVDEFIFI